jgi:hypothetical protein
MRKLTITVLGLAITALACGRSEPAAGTVVTYDEDRFLKLFEEWRAFQKPATIGTPAIPDYSSAAMVTKGRGLAAFQRRLADLSVHYWTIPRQVDYHILRAEMNGLDFDLRVLRPWANDPSFYMTMFGSESDQPAREANYAYPSTELWSYAWPLEKAAVAELLPRVQAVPAVLDQARVNLVGNGRDLWTFGVSNLRGQSADLAAFGAKLVDPQALELKAAVDRAKAATDAFATWVEAEATKKTGPSGVGRENYDWYLKNVQLLPYTWQELMTIMQRELARAHASLALEEQRNSKLPPGAPIGDAATYDKRFQQGVTDYMAFLKDHEILTVRDYMDGSLRERGGRFSPGPREFFGEVDHHDPQVMRTHGYHWFDKARMRYDPHPDPIRRGALLYNIFITRTEGHATGWEEMMLNAGMFDARPRSRELIYVLLAQRAARAQGDLRMHARETTLEDAAAFTSGNTPRGWLSLKGRLVRAEQLLYLRQPAYGTSYIIGKVEIERLLADRKRQLGEAFTMKRFMDEFDAAGLIPISLLRWEMTGEMAPEITKVLKR